MAIPEPAADPAAHGVGLRPRIDELLNQWQLLLDGLKRTAPDKTWHVLDEMPESWQRTLQKLNSTIGEYLNDHPTESHGALLIDGPYGRKL